MKIHEFQAKKIFAAYGIPVPEGEVADSPEKVREITRQLKGPVVVKAQIHAGGRGKGGGVKLASSPDEAYAAGKSILGMDLVTHQTRPEGQKVRQVLVEKASSSTKEFYIGIVIDRARFEPVIMASAAGGMDIEEIAAHSPEKIIRAAVDPSAGLSGFLARKIIFGLGLDAGLHRQAAKIVESLYKIFVEKDCSLIEINPLVITQDQGLLALDAKINFDDDALSRHPDIRELFDPHEQEPLEREAALHKLNYIKLDGNVGCMVNGAGLAMATMDLIKLAGGEPANFLDVGGGASAEQVERAFRILVSDKNVKVILINIFGGILRCERVANGIIEALNHVQLDRPLVIRLDGTNAEEGRRILNESGLSFEVATTLDDAAQRVARLAAV
ncbi:MAG: ADP-forming succinate--CoA ligase subunit beta [Pseudomonadota bacterium]